jgi:hypothetical protein
MMCGRKLGLMKDTRGKTKNGLYFLRSIRKGEGKESQEKTRLRMLVRETLG